MILCSNAISLSNENLTEDHAMIADAIRAYCASLLKHGEPIPDEKLFTGLHESFELLRAMLLDAVERAAVRTEEDFYKELLS